MKKPLTILNKPVHVPRYAYERPLGVVSPELKINVITPKTISNHGDDYVFFSFNEQNYLTLAEWLEDILRYIKSQNVVISLYEDEVSKHNEFKH